MSEAFLNGRITLHCGDNREVLKGIPDCSIDSIVTDPPYALVSITKRFGGKNAAGVKVPEGGSGAYARASAGFMGKQWDTGETAFATEFWAEVLRVLKPGAHLVAFGASRGYHRMACAIEDAGFEIRDSLMWLYGTGFPKSHDVAKDIDKRGGKQVSWFGPWLKAWREEHGIKQSDVAALFPSKTGGKTGCVANWELGFNLPTPEQFNLICTTFGLPFDSLEAAEREVIGQQAGTRLAIAPGQGEDRGVVSLDLTRAATDAAREWEGWGTALKPAFEPIVLARKPLSEGTVAANVLRWRTGALNIDACRIALPLGEEPYSYPNGRGGEGWQGRTSLSQNLGTPLAGNAQGRWPANVCHDGSDEVVAGFPRQAGGGGRDSRGRNHQAMHDDARKSQRDDVHPGFGDSGSAARFFYSAKASRADRAGSKHPTVKPVSLMEWLCALVTPPGGTVLDPFAGSGTTGVAARAKGFNAILIEREEEYQADIRRRMALCLAGPEERARESIKAKLKDRPVDAGPLFSGSDTPPSRSGNITVTRANSTSDLRSDNRADRIDEVGL